MLQVSFSVLLQILTFETKNPVELAERLRAVCGNQSNAYTRLLEYRLNALRGLWGAQRQLALRSSRSMTGSSQGAPEEPTTRRWPCLSDRASCNLNITTILTTLRCPPAPIRRRYLTRRPPVGLSTAAVANSARPCTLWRHRRGPARVSA